LFEKASDQAAGSMIEDIKGLPNRLGVLFGVPDDAAKKNPGVKY
jgi:hypothetical protein